MTKAELLNHLKGKPLDSIILVEGRNITDVLYSSEDGFTFYLDQRTDPDSWYGVDESQFSGGR